MGFWPLRGTVTDGHYLTYSGNYDVNRTVNARTVTSGASPHTKGAWVEVVTSAPRSADILLIRVASVNITGSDTSTLYDIAFGQAGSERIVIENLLVGFAATAIFAFPLRVQAGERISVRSQSVNASDGSTIYFKFLQARRPWGNEVPQASRYITYGADISTSSGTPISNAGFADTWGPWAELTPSTSYDHRVFITSATLAPGTAAVPGNWDEFHQLGIGAAGSECPIPEIPGFAYANTSERLYTHYWLPWIDRLVVGWNSLRVWPAGSRLAVRKQSESSTGNPTVAVVYGGV